MNRLLALLQPSETHQLWVDGTDYYERLLAGGSVPWMDLTAGVSWLRKSQQLLGSDVVELDVFRVVGAFCAACPELPHAMRHRHRTGYALKVLLADTDLRSHLLEWVEAAHLTLKGKPLCLRLWSPSKAIDAAWQLAHGEAPSDVPDDNQIDLAALYLADFLRTFGSVAVDAILLEEHCGEGPSVSKQTLYQSVINVAVNYRFAAGLAWPSSASPGPIHTGFEFVVADTALEIPSVIRVPDGFWLDKASPPTAQLCLTRIPVDARPEEVLRKLSVLRDR